MYSLATTDILWKWERKIQLMPRQKLSPSVGSNEPQCLSGGGSRRGCRTWRDQFGLSPSHDPAVRGMGTFKGISMLAKLKASPPAQLKLNILLQGNSDISKLGFAVLGKGNSLSTEYES